MVTGLSPDGETRDFRGSAGRQAPSGTRRSFAEAWMVLRRSRSERATEGRCLQTGSGCSRCLERIWSSCRLGLVRWSRSRRETSCGSEPDAWLSDSKRIVFTGDSGDGKPRGYVQEIPAGIPRAITPEGVVLAGKAAVRDDNSILGRVGATWALFPIHGGEASPFRRSGLEISRFNGARTADTCIRSTTSAGPGRRPSTSFAWSSRPAAGFSGKRSRRPTLWASKT